MKNNIEDKQNKKNKSKSILKIFNIIFIIFTVIGIIAWIGLFSLNHAIGDEQVSTGTSGNNSNSQDVQVNKKDVLNILFCGENQNLTDTMMYIKYDVKSGKMWIMSIPRDTYIKSSYAPGGLGGHKLNCIYANNKNSAEMIRLIQNITGVNMDYYVVVSNEIVRELVDAIGGVEVNVPIRMKYDDPTQKLHIDLKPGLQVLNGSQAEQFIRFRHNNDGTGYSQGDIERISVQQKFIKAFISTVLSAKNIPKIPDLINIVLKNTDTNMTAREALKYVTDVPKIQTDSIVSMTAPGSTKDIRETGSLDNGQIVTLNISYFVIDETETQRVIKEEFVENPVTTTDPNNTVVQNTVAE